ncbi:thioredoxin [Clostridium minihomine]|uniref:thioredoxin n=1 Tax=Clostridium minihomine TaxID=2045012 RepID=UPI000C762829|nr:thioredoxin [Clostridium minihomine]
MEIIHANAEEFDKLISENSLVLVDFWASWCGPCRMVAPIVEELAKKFDGQLTVAKVDVDDQQDLARRFGIMSIPTLILFKNGAKEWSEVGVKSQQHFEDLIQKALN